MKNGKHRRMYLQEFERGVRDRRKARLQLHYLKASLRKVRSICAQGHDAAYDLRNDIMTEVGEG